MVIDKEYIKKVLNILQENPAPYMRLSALGLEMGLLTGDIKNIAAVIVNEDQVGKFRGHLSFLKEKGFLKTSDPKFGLSVGLNGHLIINTSASYELTPHGHDYLTELNRDLLSAADKQKRGWFKKIWHDPVGSKVIGTLIAASLLAAIGYIYHFYTFSH